MRMRAAGMAAMMQQMYPEAPFEKVLDFTTKLLPVVERMDEVFSGTGDQLMQMADFMLKFGMSAEVIKVVTDETGEAKKNFVAMAEAIKAVTAGQNFQIQLAQELRALSSGQARINAALMQLLIAQNAELKKMIPLWIKQGTLLENIAPYLEGFVKSADEVAKLLSTQRSTWETIVNRVLRAALIPAYEDITKLQEYLNKLIFDAKGDLTDIGEILTTTIQGGWEAIRLYVQNTYEFLRALLGLLGPILRDVLGIQGGWEATLKAVLQILALVGELWRKVADFYQAMYESLKLLATVGREAWEAVMHPTDWNRWMQFRKQFEMFPEQVGKPMQKALGVPETFAQRWQEIWKDLLKPSQTYLDTLERIKKVGETPTVPGAPPWPYRPRPKPEEEARDQARALQERVRAEERAYEQIAELEDWSTQERIAGLNRLLERNKEYYSQNHAARRDMLIKIKRLEESAAQEELERQRQIQEVIEARHRLDFDMGKVTFDQHIEWVRQQMEKYEEGSRERVEWERSLWMVQRQRTQWLLAVADEEIARTRRGYQEKLDLIDQLLASEQDLQTQLMLQQERRSTLTGWLYQNLSLLDDERLTLEQQKVILEDLVEKWAELGAEYLPEIESRLRRVNDALAMQGFTIRSIILGSTQELQTAFSNLFYTLMEGTANFRDFMLNVLRAIERRLADLIAQWALGGLFSWVLPAVPTPVVSAQQGALIRTPQLVMAGEAGPEVVAPLQGPGSELLQPPVTLVLQTLDSVTGVDWLMRNRQEVAQAVLSAVRDNVPLRRSR